MTIAVDFTEGFDYYPTALNADGVGVDSTWIPSGDTHASVLVAGRFEGLALQCGAGNSGGDRKSVKIITCGLE